MLAKKAVKRAADVGEIISNVSNTVNARTAQISSNNVVIQYVVILSDLSELKTPKLVVFLNFCFLITL